MHSTLDNVNIGDTHYNNEFPAHYHRRQPENTLFYQVIQEYFSTYCSLVDETDEYNYLTLATMLN